MKKISSFRGTSHLSKETAYVQEILSYLKNSEKYYYSVYYFQSYIYTWYMTEINHFITGSQILWNCYIPQKLNVYSSIWKGPVENTG